MIVELGNYKAKAEITLNRYFIREGQEVRISQVVVNEDADLSSVTLVISAVEQIRVPIKTFIKYFKKRA